jgi:hypothetical protein
VLLRQLIIYAAKALHSAEYSLLHKALVCHLQTTPPKRADAATDASKSGLFNKKSRNMRNDVLNSTQNAIFVA